MKKKIIKNVLLATLVLPLGFIQPITPTVSADDEIVTTINTDTNSIEEIQKQIEQVQKDNENLKKEIKSYDVKIKESSKRVAEYKKMLAEQARSAQVNNSSTNVINQLLDSESVTDAINRVMAMNTLTEKANENMKKTKSEIDDFKKVQKDNQEKINKLYENEELLKVKKAELEYAELERKKAEEAALLEAQAKLKQAESDFDTYTKPVETPQPSGGQSSNGGVNHSSSGNHYPVGECTWGVKELAPWVGTYWGNGGQWAYSAQADGYTVGSTPQVGAVAVWTDGGYGHVAVVTAVNGSQIRVKESNYAGNRYVGDFRGWFNPVADGVTSYIYPNK